MIVFSAMGSPVTALWCAYVCLHCFYHQIMNCLVYDMATLATAERPCTHPKLVVLYATAQG